MKPYVYLAGQITKNWWRNALTNTEYTPKTRIPFVDVMNYHKDDYFYSTYECEDFIVTGPHAVGCDHGCFHDFPHAASGYCLGSGDTFVTTKEVCDACCDQIKRAEVLFAYIEEEEAFGTFAEIGVAKGLGKYIHILFKTKKLAKKLWFLSEMADAFSIQDGEDTPEIRKAFQKCMVDFEHKKISDTIKANTKAAAEKAKMTKK